VKPQLLLFDLDGTLIDSRADLAAAVNRMRALHGLPPLDLETVTSYVGDGILMLVRRALQGTDVDPVLAVDEVETAYAGLLTDHTLPYPGVDDGLRALKAAGHRLALITNKPGRHARVLCDYFGWTDLFEAILGGGDTEELKPSPLPLQLVMNQTGFLPGDTWMIGDHHTDLEAAQRAGVRSVFLENGIGHPGEGTPDHSYPGFAEFAAAFPTKV
jgi:phosphoglycolate phosphatase